MSTVALIREQINTAHDWLEAIMGDVSQAQADMKPRIQLAPATHMLSSAKT